MPGVIDVLVDISPILTFFLVLALLVIVVYQSALLGSAYSRMGAIVAQVGAIFRLMFGQEGLTEAEDADKVLAQISGVLADVKRIQASVKQKVVQKEALK